MKRERERERNKKRRERKEFDTLATFSTALSPSQERRRMGASINCFCNSPRCSALSASSSVSLSWIMVWHSTLPQATWKQWSAISRYREWSLDSKQGKILLLEEIPKQPVDMVNIPLFAGLHPCQVVQDFFHQQCLLKLVPPWLQVWDGTDSGQNIHAWDLPVTQINSTKKSNIVFFFRVVIYWHCGSAICPIWAGFCRGKKNETLPSWSYSIIYRIPQLMRI